MKTDQEIEARCAKYMETEIDQMETEIEKKADKAIVDDMQANIVANKTEISALARDVSDLSNLLNNEDQERERRKNNKIIKGLPEKDDTVNRVYFASV